MDRLSSATVASCIKARDRLGHFDAGWKPGSCPKCEGGSCTGFYTKPVPETQNERIARSLRTLADQIEAGEWDGAQDICTAIGERLDRIRRDS
jgi:hypothetical protein